MQRRLFVFGILLIWMSYNEAIIFKFTNAVCESYNKSWVVINNCRLRAINRNKTVLNINITFLHPCNDIFVAVQLFKRANGYKPWLFKATVDACQFTRKSYNPTIILIYSLFKEFSNINHTCPYMGDQIIQGFYLRPEILRLPYPTGEYLLEMHWILDNKTTFITNEYFQFTENLL
ncbi:uncharacterized protein LOC133844093 [Drosophila sulfurigaster albostrigata]|uniref:uncharacterized protein LOC133844093 n=1 Tax=Drosophila sulfurigaster albostrigata TaxID=89887 RepID=UPI002D2192DA|nr:uncharacterized protein LOC133844093 [Drosophila sulfurigaster albostrigata]